MDENLYKVLDAPITVGKNPKVTLKMADVLEDVLAELTADASHGSMTLDTLYEAIRIYWEEPWRDRDEG